MLEGVQPQARETAKPLMTWELEQRAPADEVVVTQGEPRVPGLELAPRDLRWRRMVRWYDPRNLLRSATEVLVSTVIGKHADQRQIVGHAGPNNALPRFFDYRKYTARDARGELWIDYVADTGDGWDSTFTVARGVGAAKLAVGGPPGSDQVCELPRASILVLGGDEVYPVGSRRGYDERLVAPYAAAIDDLADTDPHPDVYALPGNHDWYDSLVAFSRKFICTRWFAHWRTRQNRSYFALRLPGRWWLLGTDVQLSGDIDGEQLAYFEHVASHMADDDRVILCNPEPHWIVDALSGGRDRYHAYNLDDLETRVLKDRTWVYLAGDLHHYRRHTCRQDGRLKITAGGGGAFMHPTHTNLDKLATITDPPRPADPTPTPRAGDPAPPPRLADATPTPRAAAPAPPTPRRYELERASCFPPPAQSRKVVLLNLLPFGTVWRQPLFFVVPALLYLISCWMVPLDLTQQDIVTGFGAMLYEIATRLLFESRGAALWTALVLVGFVMLTPPKPTWVRFAGGLAHAFAHLTAVMLCAWLATQITIDLEQRHPLTYLLQGALVVVMGGMLGSMIFGWYLAFMCEVFGVHANEATATQGWAHWKSFLRLRIGADGDLTIYPIGIARTPRWTCRGYRKGGPRPAPRDGRKDHEIYRLIEDPIVVRPRR